MTHQVNDKRQTTANKKRHSSTIPDKDLTCKTDFNGKKLLFWLKVSTFVQRVFCDLQFYGYSGKQMEKNRNAHTHTHTFWHHIATHALTNGRTFFFSSVLHFPLIASLGIRLHFLRFVSIILLHPFYPSRFLPSLSQTVKYHNGTEFFPNHTQIRLFTSFPIFDFPDNVLRLSFQLEAIQC